MKINYLTDYFASHYRKTSLRTLLVVPSVLLIFLAVVLTGYLSLRNGQNAVNDVTTQLREEITARIQQHLYTYLETPHLVNQINSDAIRLGLLNMHDLGGLERHFWHQLQLFDSVSGIYLGTEQGGIIAVARYDKDKITVQMTEKLLKGDYFTYSTDSQGNRTDLVEVAHNYDATKRPWYESAVQAGKPVWSDIYTFVYPAGSLGITANQPFYDNTGKLQGVLAADFMLVKIGEFLHRLKIGRTGQTFIMERSGLIVASSTAEPPFLRVQGSKEDKRLRANDSRVPLIRASTQYLLEYFGDLAKITSTQQLNFTLAGERQFLQVTPLQDNNKLNWLIVVVVPEVDFLEKINANTRITVLLLIIVAVIIALLVGTFISRWAVDPILNLNLAAKALAKGEWNQTVKLQREDEVGQLAQSFNFMSQQLQDSFAALQQAYTVAESARQTAEAASRAKSTFLANMSHELRTPLNAIIGYSNLIQEETVDLGYEDIIPHLEKIQKSGNLLLAIISDVLDISKIEAEKMEVECTQVEVASLVEKVVAWSRPFSSSSNNNRFIVHCSPAIGTLYTDVSKLGKILENLLSNADKFTHQGTITLTVSRTSAGVFFEVADTGIGIAPEHLPHIFKPFHQGDNSSTRRYGGTGLGLTVCTLFCQMMAGKITVTSELGKGSVFTVYCPAKEENLMK
jgi:signal transduction histidine kinase